VSMSLEQRAALRVLVKTRRASLTLSNMDAIIDGLTGALDLLDKVLALHYPHSPDVCVECHECEQVYPCDTIRALDGGGA
jgi:hypothetical protein